MTGAEQRSSLPYEGKAPSFHTGKGLAPGEASSEESEDEFMEARGEVSPPSDPPSPWEEALASRLEAYGRGLEWHGFWPTAIPNFGSRGEELECSTAREWAKRKGLRLPQCDCHSEEISWRFPRKDYAWHPPRPLGCGGCLKKKL